MFDKKYTVTARLTTVHLMIALMISIITASSLPNVAAAQQYGASGQGKGAAQSAPPAYDYPTITTRWRANVRKGPHIDAPVATVLPARYTARITGRNIKGTWWEIATIEQYPKQLGWIARSIVYTYGDAYKTPALAHPMLTIHDKPAYVYVGPGSQYQILGETLANATWVPTGRTAQNDWWQVQWEGYYGWINAEAGAMSGDFWWLPVVKYAPPVVYTPTATPQMPPTPTPYTPPPATPTPYAPDVPVYKAGGYPPTHVCVVKNPGAKHGDYVNVHIRAGHQWGLTAYLTDWAQVTDYQRGWYQLQMGAKNSGWVWAQAVELSGSCSWQPVTPTAAPSSGTGY